MMGLDQMQGMLGGGMPKQEDETVQKTDTAETIYISSLALLKMLKHSRAGVPLEVMGLMLGKFVDEYTITVVDVFAMPQSGTQVSVESIDPAYQSDMIEMLQQTQRNEAVVGWYHSHPGFGPWLSSTDINTQKSFEQLHPRAVAVVIDPIQSVRGKVVMDAFRLIDQMSAMMKIEPRQTTSNVGHIVPHGTHARAQGLDQYYYSININYRKNELEQKMLLNLYKSKWTQGMEIKDSEKQAEKNQETLKLMTSLAQTYTKWVEDEMKLSKNELAIRNVGKIDPKKHISQNIDELMTENVLQVLGTMTNIKSF